MSMVCWLKTLLMFVRPTACPFKVLKERCAFWVSLGWYSLSVGQDDSLYWWQLISVFRIAENTIEKHWKDCTIPTCHIADWMKYSHKSKTAVCEIMSKNVVGPERPQTIWRMHVACWISKTTRAHRYTHTQYYLLLFHGNSGFVNTSECYVITLSHDVL
jgi:hypothetical protein